MPSSGKKKSLSSSKKRLLKIPFQAYLHPEQIEGLKALSERTREPQQRFVREGVDLVLAHYQHVVEQIVEGKATTRLPSPPVLTRLVKTSMRKRK